MGKRQKQFTEVILKLQAYKNAQTFVERWALKNWIMTRVGRHWAPKRACMWPMCDHTHSTLDGVGIIVAITHQC